MTVDSRREFKTDMTEFNYNTKRRIFIEVLVLLSVSGALFSGSNVTDSMPVGVKWVIVIAFSLYIVFGLLGYSKAKSVVEKLRVRFLDKHMEFLGVQGTHTYSYSDLSIAKIKRKGGSVVGIKLLVENNGSLWLSGFEDMEVLFGLLSDRLKGSSN